MSKTSSDHLFQLIHGMSSSEKRYFKRFLLLHGGQYTSSGKLFDAYNRQSVFDEKQLQQSERYLSGFAQQKKQLHDLLMRSLRAYHSGSNTDMKIRALLSDAEILRRMRMYDAAKLALQKAAKLSRTSENILMHAEVLRKTDELHFDNRQRAGYETYKTVLQEELQLLHRYEELVRIKSKAKAAYALHYADKLPVRKTINSRGAATQSLPARRLQLSGMMADALRNGNVKLALQHAVKHVQLVEAHPLLINDYPYEYLKALSSQLVLEDQLSLHQACMITIRKMRQLHRQSALRNKLRAFESHTFVYTYTTEFNALVKQKKFADALRLVPEIVRGLAAPGNRITDSERKVFYQIFSLGYLYTGNPQLAYRWSARALNQLAGHRNDLDFSLLLIRMLSTFEKNDTEFLRTLFRKDAPLLAETGMGDVFQKLVTELVTVLIADEPFKKKQRSVHLLLEYASRPAIQKKLQPALDQFDLLLWMRSFTARKTMGELA